MRSDQCRAVREGEIDRGLRDGGCERGLRVEGGAPTGSDAGDGEQLRDAMRDSFRIVRSRAEARSPISAAGITVRRPERCRMKELDFLVVQKPRERPTGAAYGIIERTPQPNYNSWFRSETSCCDFRGRGVMRDEELETIESSRGDSREADAPVRLEPARVIAASRHWSCRDD